MDREMFIYVKNDAELISVVRREIKRQNSINALKHAGKYFATILTGETTILPDELFENIDGWKYYSIVEDDNIPLKGVSDEQLRADYFKQSVECQQLLEYTMARLIEVGFATLKKEFGMSVSGVEFLTNPATDVVQTCLSNQKN